MYTIIDIAITYVAMGCHVMYMYFLLYIGNLQQQPPPPQQQQPSRPDPMNSPPFGMRIDTFVFEQCAWC